MYPMQQPEVSVTSVVSFSITYATSLPLKMRDVIQNKGQPACGSQEVH